MKELTKLEDRILELVLSDRYQPLKPKAIAKKLNLVDEEREVKRNIKRLIKKGKLAYGPKHLVIRSKVKPEAKNQTKSKSTKSNEVTGQFRRATAGFGFVTPLDATTKDRSKDIFIPKSKTDDAADRDIVKVRVSKRRDTRDGRISGRIIEVVKRHTHQFVGTYQEHGNYGIVMVDGEIFESGILVGDAGAKNCKIGDKVVIEMANFPSIQQDGEGVIVEVLGDRGKPGVDTLSIIRQFDLPDEFPEHVLEDARKQAEVFDETISSSRTDFTNKTVVTIDPKTARDFDDAISLERLENGHWELGVHIADVSHFVPHRSDLDEEAFNRGTSVYLPDRVIPMLPEIISNNLASLQPNRVRYCMTALIEFTDDGVPIGTALHRGAIRSVHRFNYEEIDEFLADDKPWKKKLTPSVFELVRNMHTLAMKLRKRRMDGGAINLILPEVKIDLDDDGKVAGAHTVENTESHQVIEEFMLAANEAVATRLHYEKLYYMRRVHPNPSESKLSELTEFVRQLGIDCESLQSRFEVKRIIEESEDMPECHAVHYAVLRSMQKATYSPEEVGHYALNSNNYCHFTSPIRRYPDLIIHRMVGDLIDGKKPDSNFERLAMLGKHCSDQEKRAADAERELIKLKLLNFMADKIGHQMTAVITGVESYGVFAQGIEIPAEGLIPLDHLPPDTYQYDRGTRSLSGFREGNEFRLGDKIEVQVAAVDPDTRTLEFEMAGQRNPRKRPERSRRSTKHETKRSRKRNISTDEGMTNDEGAAPARRKRQSPTEWEIRRASGPQKGQKKKRRTRKPNGSSSEPSKKKSRKTKSTKKKSTKKKAKSSKATSQPASRTASKKSKSTGGKASKTRRNKSTKNKSPKRKTKTSKSKRRK